MSEFKPAKAYACGMVTMLGSAMVEHGAAHGGKKPAWFVLHDPSLRAYEDESLNLFGHLEKVRVQPFNAPTPAFMGVPIARCPHSRPNCFDYYIDVEGKEQIL